jgi:hypothetical protein
MTKKLFLTMILLTLVLTACGAASPAAPARYSGQAEGDYAAAEAPAMAPMPGGTVYDEANYVIADTTGTANSQQMVIKNADLSIIVEDPVTKMDEIGQMAETMGGFIVTSNVYQNTLNSGVKVPHASISVRVLAEHLDEALEQIKTGVTEVQTENVSGQDVTSDYTNLASRLRNLEAAEEQLMQIMDAATKTEDVLTVFNQLTSIREQIEVIKGQMQYYEESAALSLISVEITADEAMQPIQIGGWQPVGVAKDAVEMLIKTLQWLVNVGIWFVICILPIGLIIGVPIWLGVRAVVRARNRRKVGKVAAETTEPDVGQEE